MRNWDIEAKLDFFDAHGSEVPGLLKADSLQEGPSSTPAAIQRLESFGSMDPRDLEKIVTLQTIVQSDLAATAVSTDDLELRRRIETLTSSDVYAAMQQNLMATPALSSSGAHPPHPSNCTDHSHNHSHDHSHSSGFADHDNPDPNSFYAPKADVTQGKVETMDR